MFIFRFKHPAEECVCHFILYPDDPLIDVRICKENSNTEDIRDKERGGNKQREQDQ